MNKIVKRVMTMFVAGAMALSLLAPVTGVSAASRNSSQTNASLCSVTKKLTVKSTKVTVGVGKTAKISATATPVAKITYKSSNKKIATVNAKGVITGKKAGKAIISVKANGKTVKVTVTVKKSESVKAVAASNTMPEDYSTKPVKFQSKIDAFHKQFREIPLTDEETKYSEGRGIELQRLEIDGTQLYEALPNDGKVKPLLIQMHGGGWHKEWGAAVDMRTIYFLFRYSGHLGIGGTGGYHVSAYGRMYDR